MVGALVLFVTAVTVTSFFQWRGWTWKWNLGIRLCTLFTIAGGIALNVAFGEFVRDMVSLLFGWLGTAVAWSIDLIASMFGQSAPNAAALGSAIGTAGPYLLAGLLGLLIVVSWLPDRIFPDKIDWVACWSALLVVPLLNLVGGSGGQALDRVFGALGDAGARALAEIFGS